MGQLKFKRSHLSIPSTNDPSSLLSLSFPKSSKLILSLSTCQVCLVFCSPRKKPQPKLPSMASTMVASKLIVASKLASKLASVLRHELQLQCLAVASLPTYYFTQSSLVASLASWPHLSSHAKAAWQQAHKLTSSQAGRESCCCCAALASPQAPPSAGQSSAERWWVLAGVPAQADQRGNVVLDGNAGL